VLEGLAESGDALLDVLSGQRDAAEHGFDVNAAIGAVEPWRR